MANSSRLVFPRNTAPALFNFWITVASYAARYDSKIFEPAVADNPSIKILSLIASGAPIRYGTVPFSARCKSAFSAARIASSSFKLKYAPIFLSASFIYFKNPCVISRALNSFFSSPSRKRLIVRSCKNSIFIRTLEAPSKTWPHDRPHAPETLRAPSRYH